MTLQEAKDQIAKSQGFQDWKAINDVRMENNLWPVVSRLYAGSKWYDACKVQREECYHQVINHHTPEAAWSAPQPEFKP